MKATIEVPDDLYRHVKAKAALEGRTIREVTIELYQAWLTEDAAAAGRPTTPEQPAERAAEQQLADWFKLADELMAKAPPGPTAREHLEAGRNRLEPE